MRFSLGQLILAPAPPRSAMRRNPASYDWQACRYEWCPAITGERFTLDVEHLDTPIPDVLNPGFSDPAGFFAAWTRAEALAKYFQIPILAWIKREKLTIPILDQPVAADRDWPGAAWTYTGLWPQKNLVFTCAWNAR